MKLILLFSFLILGACAENGTPIDDKTKGKTLEQALGEVPIQRQSFNSEVIFLQTEDVLKVKNQGSHMKEGFCAETLPVGLFAKADEHVPNEIEKRLDTLARALERKSKEIVAFKDSNFTIYTWKIHEGLQWFFVTGRKAWTVSMDIKLNASEDAPVEASVFYTECKFDGVRE